MIEIHTFTFNAFSEQTYLLDHGNGDATVVDPGMSTFQERQLFANFCDSKGLNVVQCLLTHAHLDHIMGAAWVYDQWKVKPRMHERDAETYSRAPIAASIYGVNMDTPPPLGEALVADASISCADAELLVKYTPGHAPGHVVFIYADDRWVIGGDVLFQGSVGRTDLPGCEPDALRRSIEDVMYALPDDFVVWPGHGPCTTIGEEKRFNPYVNAARTGMMQA